MKASKFILVGGALAVAFACDNRTDRLEDRQEALEDFVDSVETAVQRHDTHDWVALDTRFNGLVRELQTAELHLSEHADVGDSDEREELEHRYAKAKADNQQKTSALNNPDMEAQAELHMEKVESWLEKTKDEVAEGTENTVEDIEDATKESIAWLEENFERLGDNVQERYRKIKVEIEG